MPAISKTTANNFASALPWGILGGLFSVLYSMDAHWTRYILGFAVLHFAGILPTPPLFKLVYKIYCSEGFGYKYIRPRIHARSASAHAEHFMAARSLKRGNAYVCENQKALSVELRRLADISSATITSSGGKKDKDNDDDVLILPIPVLSDNYAYAIIYPPTAAEKVKLASSTTASSSADKKKLPTRHLSCVLIDAADPTRIVIELERQLLLAGLETSSSSTSSTAAATDGADTTSKKTSITAVLPRDDVRIILNISHIFTTHKHWDHAGGNKEFYDMAVAATTAINTHPPLLPKDLRRVTIAQIHEVEADRRRTERKRRQLAHKQIPMDQRPLDLKTMQPKIYDEEVEPVCSDIDEDGKPTDYTAAAHAAALGGVKVPPADPSMAAMATKKRRYNPYVYFYGDTDEARVSGLITFNNTICKVNGKDVSITATTTNSSTSTSAAGVAIPFIGSKTDNPHCTNTFVAHLDKISLGSSATMTVLESPGHTCGSIMFMLSFNEDIERAIFAEEKAKYDADNKKTASSSAAAPPLQMSHLIHRALFTGDCIFCGGCGAMFETKSATETLKTYDVFMGSALTAFPIKRGSSSSPTDSNTTKNNNNKSSSIDTSSSAPAEFYVSSKNILMYVGHEYTFKLVGQLYDMVKNVKDAMIKTSEAEAKKAREEGRPLDGEADTTNDETNDADAATNKEAADKEKLRQMRSELGKDISTIALDQILAEAAAKSGQDQSAGSEDSSKATAAPKRDPSKPLKKLAIRPHHAAIEQRWADINKIQDTYHPMAATIPSTLYEERRTNPLLTLERAVLVKLVAEGAHASAIEDAVYGSDERRSKL